VPLGVVTKIKSVCSVQGDLTVMTPIENSVLMSNDSLHRRRLPLSVVPSRESECSEQGDMTVMTPIQNSVHT
jgi:hypothetical protein